jgi:sugar phosphate isomerase/epimerase
MEAASPTDLSRLCIHTITTKPWPIETAAEKFSKAGVKGITVWRDALSGRNIKHTGEMLRDSGLTVVSLCRGGFFPSTDTSKRKAAIDDNKRAIEEASLLGAPLIVLVCGSDPHQPLDVSRAQIQEGIESVIPMAAEANVRLAIEPLHPMYADTRSAINTLKQANDMAKSIGSPTVGVAVDVYHLWWDPTLEDEISRCGKNGHLFAFHICDWSVPTSDLLNDRGLMGEGCIPVRKIRGWAERAGFTGFNEVEIFSNRWWKEDQSAFLEKIISAYFHHS